MTFDLTTPAPKAMAKTLRAQLAAREVHLTLREAQRMVAAQLEVESWEVLAAARKRVKSPRKPDFAPAAPILRIFDEEKAKDFYLGFLGFSLDWEHRFEKELPLYAQISRGLCKLHLSGHHGDASPGATVFISIRNIHKFHKGLKEEKNPNSRPGITKEGWGLVMAVTDPFSNRLRFCEQGAG